MSTGPRQLALALEFDDSFAREDFLAGPPNVAALALIERWPDWPARTVALVGPEGSGKSHLAAIWARAAGFNLTCCRTRVGWRVGGHGWASVFPRRESSLCSREFEIL